jgi:hypothetical protein
MHPPDLSEWLVSRALDDAVVATEDFEDLHVIKDMNSVMKLLVHASRQSPFDRDVARANAFLIQELKRRPSTTVAARDLLGKASSSLQAANFMKH